MWTIGRDTIGRYRALREMKGLSQRALAAELGVARRMVAAIESGERPVPGRHDGFDLRGKLTRAALDHVLALGTPSEGRDGLVYAIGEIWPAGDQTTGFVTIEHPEVGYDRPESADAVEALLRSLGFEGKAAVPIWESLLRERADRIAEGGGTDDLDAIIGHLQSIGNGARWPADDNWPAAQLLDWDSTAG